MCKKSNAFYLSKTILREASKQVVKCLQAFDKSHQFQIQDWHLLVEKKLAACFNCSFKNAKSRLKGSPNAIRYSSQFAHSQGRASQESFQFGQTSQKWCTVVFFRSIAREIGPFVQQWECVSEKKTQQQQQQQSKVNVHSCRMQEDRGVKHRLHFHVINNIYSTTITLCLFIHHLLFVHLASRVKMSSKQLRGYYTIFLFSLFWRGNVIHWELNLREHFLFLIDLRIFLFLNLSFSVWARMQSKATTLPFIGHKVYLQIINFNPTLLLGDTRRQGVRVCV